MRSDKTSFQSLKLQVLCVVVAVLVCAQTGLAREFKGVNFPDEVKIGQDVCKLMGIGIRKKFFITVYYGALYLLQPTTDRSQVIDSDQPKEVLIHVIYKEISADKWVEGWKEGFESNTPSPNPELQKKIDQFLNCFNESVKSGQSVKISYLPGTGTDITINGKQKAVITGHEFMAALWSIWFGKHPASDSLMNGMLGK